MHLQDIKKLRYIWLYLTDKEYRHRQNFIRSFLVKQKVIEIITNQLINRNKLEINPPFNNLDS